MSTIDHTNYQNIESAIANIVTNNIGIPVELGDFSKLTQQTPMAVLEHGVGDFPFHDRHPNFERLEWTFCLHLVFDYESDALAHQLFTEYRVALVNLWLANRYLADGNTPYPAGYNGQVIDSKIMKASEPIYFEIDGKWYVACRYYVWCVEQLRVVYN